MRTLLVFCGFVSSLSILACTDSQDLGDRPDGGSNVGDDDQGDGDQTGDPGDGDDAQDEERASGDLDGEGPFDSDDPEDDAEEELERGSFESYDTSSAGLSISFEGEPVVTATSEGGMLGCALTADLQASPGTSAAATSVVLGSDGDSRCPDGVFAVRNDAECARGLSEGCAVYRRWNDDGELEALVVGRGGYVAITATDESENLTRCDVEMRVNFAGGKSVETTFSYSYDPYGPDEAFCAH